METLPISNLSTMSKILEKVVVSQLTKYLEENNLHSSSQSGYRAFHSCETLLVRLQDDVLNNIGKGKVVIMLLLDLSAAFDTIDHDILLKRLLCELGIGGSALDWLKSYLDDRSFRVKIDQSLSDALCILFGVPQGSLLGPILFIIYIKPLQEIAKKYGLEIYLYADDSQLFISFAPSNVKEWSSAKNLIEACLGEV